MADSTLTAIRTKVRRLTRSLSTSQLTDADIDQYVNTFIQYDMPEHLRLFNLHRTLTWYTQPYIDEYSSSSVSALAAGLVDFDQNNLTVNPPVYVAGYQVQYTQSRSEFYNQYNYIMSINSIGTGGDGITVNFTGTLPSVPVLRNNVNFVSIDANNDGLRLSDDGIGGLSGDGFGTIDYITGAFNLTFNIAPGAGQAINFEVVPYVASRPQLMLYYNNTFFLRPVPDQVYPVNIEVYVRPTELLLANQSPELEEWWQYIAYGAAKKVMEDRFDVEGIQVIMPEFKMQERLVLRRTIVQQTNERVATIYTENVSGSYGNGNQQGPGGF
jgi:hypothetical protein